MKTIRRKVLIEKLERRLTKLGIRIKNMVVEGQQIHALIERLKKEEENRKEKKHALLEEQPKSAA